jgi:succinyl-CoA synthetase beta subunit
MNLYEWQSKRILAEAGIPVPRGAVAQSGRDAGEAFRALGLKKGIVKAQILAGGRGAAGGVRLVDSAEEAEEAAAGLLGKPLVTRQTGPKGTIVKSLLIEEALDVKKELYLSITIDRSSGLPLLIFSQEGGKEIEETARVHPEKVFKEAIDPFSGAIAKTAEGAAERLGFEGEGGNGLKGLIVKLGEVFFQKDALLLEVNPLVLTDRFIALDAKLTIDDNSLFRHPELSSFIEPEEDPLEREAKEAGITYIRMDGDIGCLVNGAGLAMATMDLIRLKGGEPANFLDIGGSAREEQVNAAFRILFSDPNVKAVFVNILGGMIHCDMIASGIVEAVRSLNPSIPIVVRLEGTNMDEGRRILAGSGLNFATVSSMEEGAERAICPFL